MIKKLRVIMKWCFNVIKKYMVYFLFGAGVAAIVGCAGLNTGDWLWWAIVIPVEIAGAFFINVVKVLRYAEKDKQRQFVKPKGEADVSK